MPSAKTKRTQPTASCRSRTVLFLFGLLATNFLVYLLLPYHVSYLYGSAIKKLGLRNVFHRNIEYLPYLQANNPNLSPPMDFLVPSKIIHVPDCMYNDDRCTLALENIYCIADQWIFISNVNDDTDALKKLLEGVHFQPQKNILIMTAKQALDLKTTTKPMLTVLGTTLLFSGSMADQFVHFTESFIPAFVTLSVLGKSGRDEDLNFFYSQPQFGSVRCRGWNPTWDTWFPEARTEQLLLSLWPASRFICVSLILCICASVHL